MPIYDDDDDPRHGFDPPQEWEADEDRANADECDHTPDDKNMAPCTTCRKLIFDDTPRCPYCGYMQMEKHRSPMWMIGMVACCLVLMYFLIRTFWTIGSW